MLAVGLSSCHRNIVASSYTAKELLVKSEIDTNNTLYKIILPYKDSLDKKMNVVLCLSDTVLTKSVPESDLGNLMCDLTLIKAADYCQCKVDFTVLNNGGIRLPGLPKGKLTIGKIYELMPFENMIDIMEVDSVVVQSLMDHAAAKGGWQVSGIRYAIKNDKAVNISIRGESLRSGVQYQLAISDYLAQGGDNCTMLAPIPKKILNKTIRDAIIDGLVDMNSRGETVKSVLDQRVRLIE